MRLTMLNRCLNKVVAFYGHCKTSQRFIHSSYCHPVAPLVDRWRAPRSPMMVVDPVVAVGRRQGQGAAVSAGVMGAAVGDISILEL